MGSLVKIPAKSEKKEIEKQQEELQSKAPKKSLRDFYGKLPDAFPDGLAYQKKVRNEWE